MLPFYVKDDLIFINPPIKTKKELFRFLAEDLQQKGYVKNKKTFYKSLMERERLGNTELIPHIAIPHAHCPAAEKLFMSVVVSKKGIDFGNNAHGPVNVVFLFGCASSHNKDYLRLLGTTARIIRSKDFLDKASVCSSSRDLKNLLNKLDPYDSDLIYTDNKLLVITLYQQEKLTDLLWALMEVGISNASVVKSSSLGKKLAYEIPVFAGLKFKNRAKKIETTNVFVTISYDEIPRKLASILKDEGLDFEKPGNGYMQTFKIAELIGHSNEFI